HDSLDLSVTSPEQAEMVARLGEKVIDLAVPMVVDVKFGRNWKDAEHRWDELSAISASHVELAKELPDDPERTQRGSPKISSVFGGASVSEPEGETVSSVNPLPWEDNVARHICIHCKLGPPDGTERALDSNDTWIHPRCETAYITARMTEEGILQSSEHEQPQSTPLSKDEPSPPQKDVPPSSNENGHDSSIGGNGDWHSSGSLNDTIQDSYTKDHIDEPFSDASLLQQG